jgi:hypothetical protein
VAKTKSGRLEPTDKERLRSEIVEMAEAQHRLGLVSADESQKSRCVCWGAMPRHRSGYDR